MLLQFTRRPVPWWSGQAIRVPGDRLVRAHLGLVQAKAVLEVDDTLQDYSHRLPSEIEITNPRHPLAGQRVPVVSGYRWHGRAWLTVTFPDGHPARIPVQETDLAGAQVADPGGTVLPVPGIRRLHFWSAGGPLNRPRKARRRLRAPCRDETDAAGRAERRT